MVHVVNQLGAKVTLGFSFGRSASAAALRIVFLVFLGTAPIFAQTTTDSLGPRISFGAPVYDFGRVKAGEIVKHSYAFTNSGSQLLEVTNVQVGCGCTTAGEWTHRVEPGQTGAIPIQFNSSGFGGEVLKSATVHSTDRTQPAFVLQLKGTVWKPVEVMPSFAVLNIVPDAPSASALVRITNNTEEYISVSSEPRCSTAAFTATVATNRLGKEFQVEVTAVPPFAPGNARATITFATTSTNLPLVSIGVWSIVQPKLSVLPAQVTLPPGPIAVKTSVSVTIQNNSTNLITVSSPECSLTNVELAFKETIPGRAYTATLAFPAGFEIPAGEAPVLILKTSLAEQPLIRVPVTHLPKPTTSSAAVSLAPSH
jgi:hypothetical protein